MGALRRVLPVVAAAVALIAIAVWVRDLRSAFLALALLAVLASMLVRKQGAGPSVASGTAAPLMPPSSTSDDVVTGLTAAFIVVAAVLGGGFGWFGTHNVVAALGGVVIFGTAAVLVAGVFAALASLVSRAVRRTLRSE